jgi:hypothetical protein
MDSPIFSLFLASIIQFFLGALWYSPVLFGKKWMEIMEATHHTKEELRKIQKAMAPYYGLQFFLTLIYTFTVYMFISISSQASMYISPYAAAFWMWFGIVVPTQIAGVIWANTKRKFWLKQILIMTSYQFIAIMLATLIYMW